jgi:hypothetical protein
LTLSLKTIVFKLHLGLGPVKMYVLPSQGFFLNHSKYI